MFMIETRRVIYIYTAIKGWRFQGFQGRLRGRGYTLLFLQSLTKNTLNPIPCRDSLTLIQVGSKGNRQRSRKICTWRQRQPLEEKNQETQRGTLETAGSTLTKVSILIQWGTAIQVTTVWINQQWWAAGEQCVGVGISRKLGPRCRPDRGGEKQHTRASNRGPWDFVSVTRLLCRFLFFVCCNQSIRNCGSPGSPR